MSFLPYLRDTARHKVKPRIASWISWTLITGIATIAALVAHAYTSALLTGAATLVELSVVALAVKNGDAAYGWVDAVSQGLSLFGVILWLLSKSANVSLGFCILADMCAAVPTYYHGWIAPREEAPASFLIFAFGSFLSVFAAAHAAFASLAFPIYFTVQSVMIASVILLRRALLERVHR